MDALKIEMQRLEVENARLRDEHREEAVRIDTEAELASTRAENMQLRHLYEQALDDLHGERAREAEASEVTAEVTAPVVQNHKR